MAGHGIRELRLGRRYVLHVDRPPLAHGPPAHDIGTGPDDASDGRWPAKRSNARHGSQVLPFEAEDRAIRCAAEPGGTRDHDVHDGLEIGRRTRDHPQDLGCSHLLLQRFGHFRVGLYDRPVLLLQLREQAHVLDRDDRLVGEGLEERRPACRETDGPPVRRMTMTPMRLALAEQRGHQDRPMAACARCASDSRVLGVGSMRCRGRARFADRAPPGRLRSRDRSPNRLPPDH